MFRKSGRTAALEALTLEDLDRELDRLLGLRQEAARDVGTWPAPLQRIYRGWLARPDRRQAPLTLVLFAFALSVFVPAISGWLSSSGTVERIYGIDCDIEDLMDELVRRRNAGVA